MSLHDTTRPDPAASVPARAATLAYGIAIYMLFLATFLYLVGFVAGVGVPKGIDDGEPVGLAWAALINLALLGLFAVQHTIMARPAFKREWTKRIPAVIERSTFVLVTLLCLWLMVAWWQPMPGVVWNVETPALAALLWALSALGWGIVLLSTFLIDHFDLFGVRQTVSYAMARRPKEIVFRERSLYRLVRHPMMVGFIIAFWATPYMTLGHLLFAAVTTLYTLLAIQIEEKTLIELHGDAYEAYRKRVPMLIPAMRRR